jgi:hypothetical protein
MLPLTQHFRFVGACAIVLGTGACAGTLDDPARFETQALSDSGPANGDGGRAACPDTPDLFAKACSSAGCHGPVDKIQGLDLQSPNVASRLVGVRAMGGGLLIDPANPNQSVIYTKLTPTPPFGARMPSGEPALDDATVACVLSWVAEQNGSLSPNDGGGQAYPQDAAPDDASSGDATIDGGPDASVHDAAGAPDAAPDVHSDSSAHDAATNG